jgi:signal transduction histidine kinase
LNQELRARLQQLEETGTALSRARYLANLGTLAAGVAHEINNPMGVIVGSTDLIQRNLRSEHWDKNTLAANLTRIERSAWHVSKIARSLLAYARGGELALTRVSPKTLLDDAAHLAYAFPAKADHVQMAVAPDAPDIICDHDKVVQVLVNLLTNANDALAEIAAEGGPPGQIRAMASRGPNGQLVIQISDTGTGMDAETLAHIFEPFYTTKPIGKGTGLGLAICRGIVEAHNGELYITSELGRGATAILKLPPEPAAQLRLD